MEKRVPFREKIVFLRKAFHPRPLVDTYNYSILGNTNAMETKQMCFFKRVSCEMLFDMHYSKTYSEIFFVPPHNDSAVGLRH